MRRILAPLLAAARSKAAGEPAVPIPGRSPAEECLTASALADALDRAMDLGLRAHAMRIARAAARLAPRWPELSDRLARLRFACGEPARALAVIDACGETTDELRLLRTMCLVRLGRTEEARHDLRRWARKPGSPAEARCQLALLEWSGGDDHAATLALLRNLKSLEDPGSLELLVLIASAQDRPEQAEKWARRLFAGRRPAAAPLDDLLAASLGLSHEEGPCREVDETQVRLLAREIARAEHVIPSLVEAQRLWPRPSVIALLAGAFEEALPALVDPAAACEALARLAILAGERHAAARWIRRGLGLAPMSASLRILEREVGAERPSREEPAPWPARVAGPLAAPAHDDAPPAVTRRRAA